MAPAKSKCWIWRAVAPVNQRSPAAANREREGGTAMSEGANQRKPLKAPEPSQGPLWFVIIGLGLALYSRGMNDEQIAQVVLWLGAVISFVALLYWAFRPKHGLR